MDVVGKIVDPLGPYIRPITALIPAPIEQIGVNIIGEECYQVLIRDVEFGNNPECVALGISKGLSWGIVVMSSIVKVPQILKLLQSRSATGLSLISFLLETVSYLITIAYNYRSGFPFSTFGETVLISMQNIIITLLIFNYSGRKPQAAMFSAILTAVCAALFPKNSTAVNSEVLTYLQGLTIPLTLFSKIPQVYSNWQNKTTGQLSVFTVVNYLLGSLARVFTTIQEVDDPMVLGSFLGSTVLNFVLFIQVFLYWNTKPVSADKKTK
jgi:mannose-P-dolichol utilization defect protein 1